jgi:RNA polymerase sigma-70 factor (ECF subfamily)
MKSVDHTSIDDSRLVALSAEGDEKAFEHLITKYENAVFSTIYRYTGDSDCVEDLAQEIFIKVWQNAKKFKGKSAFSTWLYRIVVNHCLNYNSKRKLDPSSLDELTQQGQIPVSLRVEANWAKKQKIQQVQKAVRELPKRQRIALVLAHWEHKSHEEIAQIMQISSSAVHSLIFRARRTLKRKLKRLLE